MLENTSLDTLPGTTVSQTFKIYTSRNFVAQGNYFSILIFGMPDTPYYIWVKGTRNMTGKPGDQPPEIVLRSATASGVYGDRITGPFRFGSYRTQGGTGPAILDDVPEMTPDNNPTKYYGSTLTDERGNGWVEFFTSMNTKPGNYTIRVERGNVSDEASVRVEPMQTIPPRVKGYGTIYYNSFEGGFYGIVSETGGHYDPLNLPEDFQTDGLPVSFEAITKPEHISYHMWGIPVELIRIENISPATATQDSQDNRTMQPSAENSSPSSLLPNSSTHPSPLPGLILVTAIGILLFAWGLLRRKWPGPVDERTR